jgi:hypothetical protein
MGDTAGCIDMNLTRPKGNGAVNEGDHEGKQNQAQGALNRVKQAFQQVTSSAEEMATRGLEKTEGAVSDVGGGISHFADSLKSTLSESGTVGAAGAAVSDSIKSGGEYLRTHDFSSMAKDVGEVIRRNPITAVWIGVGFGFVLGKVLLPKH